MIPLIILGLVILLGLTFLMNKKNDSSQIEQLSALAFQEEFSETPSAVLVDVRTPEEYNSAHIPGAINIDFENQNFLSEIEKLNKTNTYFVYCQSGNRSGQAVSKMKDAGILNIRELDGGLISNPEILKADFSSSININLGDESKSINLQATKQNLSKEEISGLVYMREEEKLAYDVYMTLYSKWNIPIFSNIASSEQTHTNAVKSLLSYYEIPDPVTSDTIGVFKDTNLKKLYETLTEQGLKSVEEALIVGATIEDLDIFDLQRYISETNNPNIINVYENLMKGSRNHLRSFASQLASRDITYKPKYISIDEFNLIINSEKETGANQRNKSW